MSAPALSPSVSVLIPAFNEEELISEVIDSVRKSFSDVGIASYEIIVCDNNSTDATAERAAAKGAKVVRESHNQISRARNKAAAHAVGQWLIFLDGDTFLSAELLRATTKCLESGQICGGGSLVKFNTATLGPVATGMLGFWNQVSRRCSLAAGSYIFCYREAWIDVGGFDEKIYAGEELYFSRAVRRWGKKKGMRFVVLTEAPIVTSARKLEWYGGWRLLGAVIALARPSSLQSRERCHLWYTRPNGDTPAGTEDCSNTRPGKTPVE